jgi:hypothetical protein
MAGRNERGEFSSSKEVAHRKEKDSEAGHTEDSVKWSWTSGGIEAAIRRRSREGVTSGLAEGGEAE